MYPEESSNAEDDGIEGVNLASSVDTSIENRQDSGHVTYENSQGMQTDINTKFTKNLFHNFMRMYVRHRNDTTTGKLSCAPLPMSQHLVLNYFPTIVKKR